jgi:hypothetical protein
MLVKRLTFAAFMVAGGAAVASAQVTAPTAIQNQNSAAGVAPGKSTQHDKLGTRPDDKQSGDSLIKRNTTFVAPPGSAEEQGQPGPVNMNQVN